MNAARAMSQVQRVVNQRGVDITILEPSESQVVTNAYGDKVSKRQGNPLTLKAFPITENPTEREVEKAGFKDRVDLIVYTSSKDWREIHSKEFSELKTPHMEIQYNGGSYEVKQANRHSQFENEFLYIVFGGIRK